MVLSVYIRVRCTKSLNILWFWQYTYQLRALRHFYHTVVLSVYLRVTCTTSLLTYCGFVSISTSYVHNVTFNILWYRDMKYLRCKWVSEWVIEYMLFNAQWTVLSATSWWEPVAFRWIVDDDVRFVLDQHMKMDLYSTSSLKEQSEGRYCALIGHSEPNIICSYSLVLRAFH